jgi:hypothetical protein
MDNPDKDIEDFWLTLKCCVVNFYKYCNLDLDITTMSNELNLLQKSRDYINIEYKINEFIIELINIMFQNINKIHDNYYLYNTRIILTNLNRWIKIREKKLFVKDDIETENNRFLLVKLFSNLLKTIEKKKHHEDIIVFFTLCRDTRNNDDYGFMIDFAIELKNASMLETLDKVIEVRSYINNRFDTNFFSNMSFNKIIKKLPKK